MITVREHRRRRARVGLVAGTVAASVAMLMGAVATGTVVPDPEEESQKAEPDRILRPTYGLVSGEGQDPGYQYRSMPALQYVRWTDRAGREHRRFVRSFQISADDGSLRTRIQYHLGGSLTDRSRWQPALDMNGRELYRSAQRAKMNTTFRARDGRTATIDEAVVMNGRGRFLVRRATADGGVHWSSTAARLDLAGGPVHRCSAGRVFQRALRLPDGSLVVPFYAAHKVRYKPGKPNCTSLAGRWFASHLLTSTNDGASWKRAATIFKSERNSYTESAVTRRADGRLIMISRYDVVERGRTKARLAYRVTRNPVNSATDLARATWGSWTRVRVPGAADAPVVQGVAPVLHTMDRGVLMLAFGRPRNKIAFSYNGGATWSSAHSFYDNIPRKGCTKGYGVGGGVYIPCASLGSSGYLGVAVTSPRKAYVMGDNCHTNWGCHGRYTYPHGRDDKLWYSTLRLR